MQLPWEEQAHIVCDDLADVDKALCRVKLVSDLDKLADAMLRDIRRARPVAITQEPGHQEYPWNEASNSISRHYANESNTPRPLPDAPSAGLDLLDRRRVAFH